MSFGQDGFEQFGLVLEVGEHGAGGHARALGDVADRGGLIAALGEERAGGVQNLLSRADLGGLAAVQAGLDSEGGDGICHIIRLLLYFRSLVGAGPVATSNEISEPLDRTERALLLRRCSHGEARLHHGTMTKMGPATVCKGLPLLRRGVDARRAQRAAQRPAWAIATLDRDGRLEGLAKLIATFVDRGEHQAHGHAQIDQSVFGELQTGLGRLRHGVGDAQSYSRMACWSSRARAIRIRSSRIDRAVVTTSSTLVGASMVTIRARVDWTPQCWSISRRPASP